MRIAYCVGRYPCWSERFLAREAAALAARGHTVLLWPSEEALQYARWLKPDGSPLPPVPNHGAAALPTFKALGRCGFLQLRRLPAVLRAASLLPWRPDLIHAHFAGLPAVIGCALAAGLQKDMPFTVSAHARDVWVPWPPGHEALLQARRIIVCNQAALNELRRLHSPPDVPSLQEKPRLIYHGLPESAFAANISPSPAADGKEVILAAGRFVPKKGFDVLLAAFARVRNQRKNLRLKLVGKGPGHLALGRQAKALGLGPDIEIGTRLDESAWRRSLEEAQLVVAPAVVAPDGDRDGIPNVVLEALALGKPVVASSVGGLPEVIRDGETGWLAPPGDAAALAQAIIAALTNPGEARRRGMAGQELVRREFYLENNIRELEAVFAELAGSAENAPPEAPG